MTLSIFAACLYISHKNRNKEYQISKFLLGIIMAEMISSIVLGFIFGFHNTFLALIQSALTVGYILIDLHMLMNNKDKHLTIDDHVYAAMMIYTDLIRLFIKIVELLNDDKKKKDKK